MKKSLFVAFAAIIFVCSNIHAQRIERWNSNFKYDGVEYSRKELLSVFSVDSTLTAQYTSGLKSQKIANTFGYISLTMLGTSAVLIFTNDNYEINAGFIWGLLTGLAASIPGTIGIVAQVSASKKKKQAINMFNDLYAPLPDSESLGLKMGQTPHGVGLVINF